MSTVNTNKKPKTKSTTKKVVKGTPLKSELMSMVSELKQEKASLENTLTQVRTRKLELENEIKSLYQSHSNLKEDHSALKNANAIINAEKAEIKQKLNILQKRMGIVISIADSNVKLLNIKKNFNTLKELNNFLSSIKNVG